MTISHVSNISVNYINYNILALLICMHSKCFGETARTLVAYNKTVFWVSDTNGSDKLRQLARPDI